MTTRSKPTKSQAAAAGKGKVDICSNAVLVHVCISQWQARILDRGTSQETLKLKKAQDSEAGKFYKILIDDPALDKWRTRSNALRGFVYKKTLPWLDGGTRIMPSKTYLENMASIQEARAELDEFLEEFLGRYETLRRKKERLGELHDDDDFPSADSLRTRFGVSVTVLPVPAGGDWRVKGAEAPAHLDALAKAADTENWRKIATKMHKVRKALAEDGRMTQRMFPALQELCEQMKAFNITENPEITGICEQIEKDLATLDRDTLKKDDKKRGAAAKTATGIHAKAAKFLKALDPNASDDGDDDE